MSRKPRAYGYVYKKKQQRKRPGRHSKKPNKRSQRKKSRGQGEQRLQIVNYFFTKHYKLTADINVFSCIVAISQLCKGYG